MDIYLEKNIDRIDKGQWNALAQKNATNTIYQSYEWNHASAHIYGQAEGAYILCVKDKDELLAIVPLMFSKTGGKRTLQFVAGHRSDYCDMLCPARQEEVMAIVWQYILSRHKEWDLIRLNNVPLESSMAQYIKGNKTLKSLSHRSAQNEAVYLRFKEDEAYTHKVLNKKKIKAYRQYFQNNGPLKALHLQKCQDIEGYLDDFFAQHIERWKGTPYPSLFLDPQNKEFYRHIVKTLPQGWITFTVLQFKEQVLGYHLGFSFCKRFIWYKPTYNVSFAQHSPGQVLLQEVMEYAYSQGFEEFDFGGGRDPYKYRFGNKFKYNNSFKVYPSKGAYLCNYIPVAILWRLEKFFAKTM